MNIKPKKKEELLPIIFNSFCSFTKSISEEAVRELINLIDSASNAEKNKDSKILIKASVSQSFQIVTILDEWRNLKLPYINEGGEYGTVNGAIIIRDQGYDPEMNAHWMTVEWNQSFINYINEIEEEDEDMPLLSLLNPKTFNN